MILYKRGTERILTEYLQSTYRVLLLDCLVDNRGVEGGGFLCLDSRSFAHASSLSCDLEPWKGCTSLIPNSKLALQTLALQHASSLIWLISATVFQLHHNLQYLNFLHHHSFINKYLSNVYSVLYLLPGTGNKYKTKQAYYFPQGHILEREANKK